MQPECSFLKPINLHTSWTVPVEQDHGQGGHLGEHVSAMGPGPHLRIVDTNTEVGSLLSLLLSLVEPEAWSGN